MDEITIRAEHAAFYRWNQKGHTPKVKSRRDPKIHASFFGGLSFNSKKEFTHLSDKQNTKELINFLNIIKQNYLSQIRERLTGHLSYLDNLNQDKEEKDRIYEGLILICLDGAGFHRSQELKDYLKENYGIFELFRFPTYSPDLNPQEHVWKALRRNLSRVEGVQTFPQTINRACLFLKTTTFDYEFV